tara:strand:- start:111 stop:245 length:135 start_codon:yes stop_codon:yes gene_type:complete
LKVFIVSPIAVVIETVAIDITGRWLSDTTISNQLPAKALRNPIS